MITDRELDARVAAAAGARDADLPALPEEFLTVLRAQPEAVEEPASVIAARQLVDARSRHTRPHRRRALVRVGAGVLALAAAWTTAVLVVDDHGTDRTPDATPSTAPSAVPSDDLPLDPPGGLALVAADAVTFPYSLDPAPEDFTPVLTRSGGLESFGVVDPVVFGALYRSADDLGFAFSVSPGDPRVLPPGVQMSPPYSDDEIEQSGTIPVDGTPADFVRARFDSPDCRAVPTTPTQEEEPEELCTRSYAELYWERADGQWVAVSGWGNRYGVETALVEVAESIVDRPQPVQLQFRLAPEGWAVSSYESLAHLSLVSSAAPTSLSDRISVSLLERWRGYTDPDVVLQGMTDGNPVEEVTVNGEPARLVSVPDHFTKGRRMWYLAAQFADGPQFLLQAPDTLSREDVLAMAEGITYTAN
jgi:hypothetical protein